MSVPTNRKFEIATSSAGATNLRGDAGRLLSITNHRLYRQGRNYHIRIGAHKSYTGRAQVFALRTDWMVANAWKLAFQTYMNNSKEELAVLAKNGGKARWQDFRVLDGWTASPQSIVDPVYYTPSGTLSRIVAGENTYVSEVHDEAGVNRFFTWGTGTASRFGMLEEYSLIANTSSSPSAPLVTAAYSTLDDDNQDGQLSQLSTDGNLPPYSANGVEDNTPWIKVGEIGVDPSGVQSLSTGYFSAPCGLFVIVCDVAPGADTSSFFLEAKSGDYKGVHSESMGTAKLVKNHYQVK